ncbi:MAG: hypothetical protein HGA69_00645 [Desulfobulbaceae bacterium]|nr:hypothetical protein [Desulfobulbaceae bacterium]
MFCEAGRRSKREYIGNAHYVLIYCYLGVLKKIQLISVMDGDENGGLKWDIMEKKRTVSIPPKTAKLPKTAGQDLRPASPLPLLRLAMTPTSTKNF